MWWRRCLIVWHLTMRRCRVFKVMSITFVVEYFLRCDYFIAFFNIFSIFHNFLLPKYLNPLLYIIIYHYISNNYMLTFILCFCKHKIDFIAIIYLALQNNMWLNIVNISASALEQKGLKSPNVF